MLCIRLAGTVHRPLFWATCTYIPRGKCAHPRDHWALWCMNNGPICETVENGKDPMANGERRGWCEFTMTCVCSALCIKWENKRRLGLGAAALREPHSVWNAHFNFILKSKIARDSTGYAYAAFFFRLLSLKNDSNYYMSWISLHRAWEKSGTFFSFFIFIFPSIDEVDEENILRKNVRLSSQLSLSRTYKLYYDQREDSSPLQSSTEYESEEFGRSDVLLTLCCSSMIRRMFFVIVKIVIVVSPGNV